MCVDEYVWVGVSYDDCISVCICMYMKRLYVCICTCEGVMYVYVACVCMCVYDMVLIGCVFMVEFLSAIDCHCCWWRMNFVGFD